MARSRGEGRNRKKMQSLSFEDQLKATEHREQAKSALKAKVKIAVDSYNRLVAPKNTRALTDESPTGGDVDNEKKTKADKFQLILEEELKRGKADVLANDQYVSGRFRKELTKAFESPSEAHCAANLRSMSRAVNEGSTPKEVAAEMLHQKEAYAEGIDKQWWFQKQGIKNRNALNGGIPEVAQLTESGDFSGALSKIKVLQGQVKGHTSSGILQDMEANVMRLQDSAPEAQTTAQSSEAPQQNPTVTAKATLDAIKGNAGIPDTPSNQPEGGPATDPEEGNDGPRDSSDYSF